MAQNVVEVAGQANDLTGSEFWDERWKTAGRHGRVLSPHHGTHGRNGYIMRMVRRHIPNLEGLSVLEVGGGGGAHRLLALTKWGGVRAFAVDYSPVGIRQTQAAFHANGCQIKTYLADFLDWEGEGHRFDLIVHWGVIEHLQDPTLLLERTANLLTSGGLTLFSMPNMEAWGATLWRMWAPVNWSYHICHSEAIVRNAAERAGLQLTKTFHYGPPLIRISAWETGGLLTAAVTAAHYVAVSLSWLLPVYSAGSGRVAQERGFLARRMS